MLLRNFINCKISSCFVVFTFSMEICSKFWFSRHALIGKSLQVIYSGMWKAFHPIKLKCISSEFLCTHILKAIFWKLWRQDHIFALPCLFNLSSQSNTVCSFSVQGRSIKDCLVVYFITGVVLTSCAIQRECTDKYGHPSGIVWSTLILKELGG